MVSRLPYDDLFIDFDDTLYDTRGNAVEVLRQLFSDFGLHRRFAAPEDFIAAYLDINEQLWAQYGRGEITREELLMERFRRPLSSVRGVSPTAEECRRMSDEFLERCAVQPGVVEGAHELVRYLRDRGYRLHICSNGLAAVQHRKIRAAGWADAFDTVVLGEEAGTHKPSPAFFAYALDRTGASARRTLMIGDHFENDVAGAMAAGLDAAFFNRDPERFVPPFRPTIEVARLSDLCERL